MTNTDKRKKKSIRREAWTNLYKNQNKKCAHARTYQPVLACIDPSKHQAISHPLEKWKMKGFKLLRINPSKHQSKGSGSEVLWWIRLAQLRSPRASQQRRNPAPSLTSTVAPTWPPFSTLPSSHRPRSTSRRGAIRASGIVQSTFIPVAKSQCGNIS